MLLIIVVGTFINKTKISIKKIVSYKLRRLGRTKDKF